MDEYIKREELAIEFVYADADVVEDYGDGECEWGFSRKKIQEVINSVPSADVAPVRKGRWIEPQRLYYGAKQYECSLCWAEAFWDKRSITEKYPYCPNCGANMRGINYE